MKKTTTLLVVICLFATTGALADDLNPPSWRGQGGTSWALWEFHDDNPNNPPPDDGWLPFGDPNITITPGPGAGWFDVFRDQSGAPLYGDPQDPSQPGYGWWNLSGEIDILLQNRPTIQPHKEIWIQITWQPQALGNQPILTVTDPENGTTPEILTPLIGPDVLFPDPLTPVFFSVYHIDLPLNPPWEEIKIRGGINIDELVIDTWCTPEPATMSLLGMGALAMLRRKRR
ncbi:MAG: PEP-CTERM sorting domain-containing protein [Phycisphaerae bacterium]|nr:PEP-CTERM sorting domain-containing protein [Phycisphaerae bacterium]